MFTLDQAVPWGRSFDEYRRMFALTDADFALSILGCGDGPASFNAEATRRGGRVVSCDPIYRWGAAEIGERIATTSGEVHRTSVREMCRVAGEVRIFPLLALGGRPSPWADPCVSELRDSGYQVSIEQMSYEFQRGGNQMMRVRRAE